MVLQSERKAWYHMDKKVLKILEYDKIIEQLEQKASSQGGKELCKNLLPMTDLSEILLAQTETKIGRAHV